MNILELDSYNLDDAVKFNDHLNPRLWDSSEHLKPEVRDQLLKIADDFREFLGVADLDLQDITVSGSNAAYTYTPNSDIDLHLVVAMPDDEVYRELFDAKKFQYNEQHNITIGGYDVELYVQDAEQPHISQGIYSVVNNDWVQVPRRIKSVVDDTSTENKFKTLGLQIERAIKSGDLGRMDRLAKKIKKMRQTGLEAHGEFGPENLAFKMLRSQGKIKELYDARNSAKDRELSLRERRQPNSVFTYGFKHEESKQPEIVEAEAVAVPSDEKILQDFIDFCFKELKLKSMPVVKLRKDPQWSIRNRTFGRYIDDHNLLEVAWGQRHIMDVLRTVAHELTHRHQHERESVPTDAGETGSPWENEANARAGVLMRNYAGLHPEYFAVGKTEEVDEDLKGSAVAALSACIIGGGSLSGCATQQGMRPMDAARIIYNAKQYNSTVVRADVAQELNNFIRAQGGNANAQNQSRLYQIQKQQDESASGYIPTKKQAKDPRFSMALTQDIRPGQLGKEANKLKLKTNKQGIPQVANPNGLFEKLSLELDKFKKGQADEDYSPDNPPGPEFAPQMPIGTVKVDVSDVYDWYKLGQHISDLEGLNKHDFGQGPPQTVLAFGSEEEEEKYIKNLKKLGLGIHDIDPPGLKGDVDEAVNAPVSKPKDAEQYYKFIVAKHKIGRPLTRQEQEYVRSYKMFNQQVAESVEQLDEVKMSPSALQKWAKSPEAQGIRAGFEAELIFRDTNSGDDSDYDMEPDYDMDERCRSIQQIIDFFSGGDYGNMSPRQERALQEGLDEQYYEWYDEQMYKDFREEAEDLIRKVMVDEGDWDLDNEIQKQLELLDLTDNEMNDIINAGERAPKFTSSKEQILYAEANPLYQKYLDAQEEAEGLLDDLIQDEVRKEGANWDAALDDFRDNYQIDDDSGFFDDVGMRWMSDVSNNYDLDWPYMTGGGSNGGSRSWEEIGDSLHGAIDMPVKVSSNYHSTPRREGVWIVEPDTSLQPDDSEDFGLEIVSPPLPLDQALEKLEQVCDWANSNEGNCYTNSSTGLHMGVSVPFKGGDVDYLKLILFLGDEYVLQSFGREANTYTKSAMSKFRENIKGGRSDPMSVIKLMQHGLLELAHKEIQKGVGDGKYTSAHIQKGYIEFRSAGGDWLAEENADPEKLSSTMLRYARAMSIAANPAEERREYANKLYKLVAPEGDSELALFSQYAAGELTAEQLKKRWAEKTIGTEKKMNQRWRLYQNVGGVWEPVPGAEWNGYPESEVKMRVWSKYGREALDTGEYQLVNMGEQDWEVYDVNTGKTLEIVKGKSKGEVADAVYDKYVDQGIGFQVRPYVDPATMTPRAKLAKRIVEPTQKSDWDVIYKPTGRVIDNILRVDREQAEKLLAKVAVLHDFENADNLEIRPQQATKEPAVPEVPMDIAQNFAPQNATDRVGSWAIYDVTLGREISRMDNVAWQQADARANELERSTGHNMSVRGLQENIDAVSGTGAIARAIAGAKPPATIPVRRKDPAVKLDIKNKPLDPYSQTYKKPVEEGYGQYTRINDPGIFPDGFLYLSNHAKHDRLPERGIDMDRVIDLCRQAGNQYPQKLRNLGDIQFVIKAPDDFGVGLVKYQTPDGHYRYLIKTAHNRLRYGPEEPVFRVDSLTETLPAKNLNQLYNIKKQLANPAFSTADPVPAEKPVPARLAQPRVHAALTDLQRQRDKVQQIMDLKQEIETLTARAGRTRYGITPGLAADIEDIYPNPATEADMDAAIQGYEVQKKKLTDYIARQRRVFPKEDMAENFADGKGPGRPGDSQRHGIPKGATMSELEKASHSKGRKGQLARWQLNMRRGKAKAK